MGYAEFAYRNSLNAYIDTLRLFKKVLGRPLSQNTQEGFFRIGMFLLLSLMFFTTFNDLKDLGLFN